MKLMSVRVAKQKPANVLSVAIVTRDPARRETLTQIVTHAEILFRLGA